MDFMPTPHAYFKHKQSQLPAVCGFRINNKRLKTCQKIIISNFSRGILAIFIGIMSIKYPFLGIVSIDEKVMHSMIVLVLFINRNIKPINRNMEIFILIQCVFQKWNQLNMIVYYRAVRSC